LDLIRWITGTPSSIDSIEALLAMKAGEGKVLPPEEGFNKGGRKMDGKTKQRNSL
jgi:hypothetical protein